MSEKQENIIIRKMVPEDIAAVNDVDNSISGKGRVTTWPFSFESYWEIYSSAAICFVAELNDKVAGFLSGYIEKEERNKSMIVRPHQADSFVVKDNNIGWIEMMGVRPEFWYKGVGTRLIGAFEEECKKSNARMRIVLRRDDPELREYLTKIGFTAPAFITLEKKV